MSRQQLSFVVTAAAAPRAEALLELAGAETIALRDAADNPVLEPEPNTAPLWPVVIVDAQFADNQPLDALVALLRDSCGATETALRPVGEEDWLKGLKQLFTARPFGRRLWLVPAEDSTPPPDGRIPIRLHLGLAFGTGEHPTTALCLDWLDAHVTRGSTVLDYGSGSGVLAIAALALGARSAWAIDNDPQALSATRANAQLNGMADRLLVAAPQALPEGQVDIVAANILAAPLIEHAPLFAARVRPGGMVVLSGILERQVDQIVAAYEPAFTRFETQTAGGWACLACVRAASEAATG